MSTIATTLDAARSAKGEIRAGGTDLMERLRHRVTTGEIIDISRIPDLNHIAVNDDETVRIGALVTIDQLANDPIMKLRYPGLTMAAAALATPQIRRAASMGGALLQRNRCWYYRHEEIACFKKGGDSCPAREGNHQFGVCFDLGPCVSPHPSTLGMALLAYDAEIEIYGRERLKIKDLYGDGSQAKSDHLLHDGDILTSIHLPKYQPGEMAAYFRSISRARAEWPLVEVLVRGYWIDGALANCRVAIGGVANIPLELPKVAQFLNGQVPSEAMIKEAAEIAAADANPLRDTHYKIAQVKGSVFHTIFKAFTQPEIENELIED